MISVSIPALNAVMRPRFGSGLTLLLFPLNFLWLYHRTPTPRLLWVATGMTIFVALLNFTAIWWTGTVDSVSNPFIDRLHSAYLYSSIPVLLCGIYLGLISWQIRHHVASPPAAA